LESEHLYNKLGIPYKRGYLLYGLPGTGKTSTVYAISHRTQRSIYKISPKWFTESVFKDAIKMIPPKSILLLEELDTQVESRRPQNANERPESVRETPRKKDDTPNLNPSTSYTMCMKIDLSEMLSILDGYEALHDCIIVATTNYPEYLDKALIRPGRFDLHLEFKTLTIKDIESIVEKIANVKVKVPRDITLTTSALINEIILPNIYTPERIKDFFLKEK
jgi:chaperone BCS1